MFKMMIGILMLSIAVTPMVLAAVPDSSADGVVVASEGSRVTTTADGNGGVLISFAEASAPPPYAIGVVGIDAGVSSGAFVGDYQAAGIEGLSFRIKTSGVLPQGIEVVLKTESGREWYYRSVAVDADPAKWVENNIPFTRDAWTRNDAPGVDQDALWANDITQVGGLSVRILPEPFAAQEYAIEAFKVAGDGFESGPAELTVVEVALEDHFGVRSIGELTTAQKTMDGDGDGMSDLSELLSENDPAFADSIFVAQIVKTDETGTTLKWACVKGAKYTVLRCSDLATGFEPVADWQSDGALVAGSTGYLEFEDVGATGGPYYYRIKKE